MLGHATPSQRKQALGQSQPVFDQSYLASLSSLHIQNLFLGVAPRRDFLEQLRSVSRFRMNGFPLHLPTSKRLSTLQHPSLIALRNKLQELRASNSGGLKEVENEVKATKHRLLYQALKKHQEEWVDTEYEKYVNTRGKADASLEPHQRRFQRLLVFIPERLRLAAVINGYIEYSEEQRISVINDLVALIEKDSEELCRPGEAPVDGCCPVASCSVRLTG